MRRYLPLILLGCTFFLTATVSAAPADGLGPHPNPPRAMQLRREGLTESHYWQLGAGVYAPYLRQAVENTGELDLARWDWMVVEIGSEDTVNLMNRLLQINPRLKFICRVWPINGLGIPGISAGTASCLDYMLYPKKQAEIDQRTRDAIRMLRSKISNWNSIVGFTFLEEIPGWWGCGSLMKQQVKPGGKLPAILAYHRKAIEAARGKPLVWDSDTRRWLARQMVESLARLHRIIKQESGGKLVFYWHATNYATLDDVGDPLPPGFDLAKWGGYPIYFKDIIKPGLCDGLMAYPNSRQIWEHKYMRLVRKNNWLFFSQLSHPGFMRLCSWADAVKMVKTKMPQNLGYFVYCEGDCGARGAWNDDPSLPKTPEWEQRRVSIPLHLRLLARQQDVGMDVVRRYNHLRVRLDARLADVKAGDVFHLVALVENPNDVTFYNDPAEATARQVRLKLSLPPGIVADPKMTAATELTVGDLAPHGRVAADWWLTAKDLTALHQGTPIKVTATSANCAPGEAATTKEIAFPAFQTHEIKRSGTTWDENGYRYGGLKPVVEITGLGAPIKNPTLSDGVHEITYQGELYAGMRLVISPGLKAMLYPDNLLAGASEPLRDATDPSGYKGLHDGYGVFACSVGRYLRPGARYRLTISGKAADGANSLVVLRWVKPGGKIWQPSVLANRFRQTWGEASAEIAIPDDVSGLQRLYLYRFHTRGTIWYGPMSLTPADIPPQGRDVSDRLSGQSLQIGSGMLSEITYRDDSPDTSAPKVRVKLINPADQKATK